MTVDAIALYHITAIGNLPSIIAAGKLLSDQNVAACAHEEIGMGHIKQRRLTAIRIPSCGNRFVGEFVPFYFCPRSPMLYTINIGKTGKPRGYQSEIVHLVTRVGIASGLPNEFAISDGNAGAFHTDFSSQLEQLDALDWRAIRAQLWSSCSHQKQSEFLVADFFPWAGIEAIGCYDERAATRVRSVLVDACHAPTVTVRRDWYY